jgi:hypothetical protein
LKMVSREAASPMAPSASAASCRTILFSYAAERASAGE